MLAHYTPRVLSFLGNESVAGYRVKLYGLTHDTTPVDRSRFAAVWDTAIAVLPTPAVAPGRPGLGFAIFHQGRTGDYFILCWWDHENELPTRVWVRDDSGWRPARNESFCVWDLRVLWWEREAYVATVLSDRDDGAEAYLGITVQGWA